jgi:hypothetical protein
VSTNELARVKLDIRKLHLGAYADTSYLNRETLVALPWLLGLYYTVTRSK